jgi:hypothetical protein
VTFDAEYFVDTPGGGNTPATSGHGHDTAGSLADGRRPLPAGATASLVR